MKTLKYLFCLVALGCAFCFFCGTASAGPFGLFGRNRVTTEVQVTNTNDCTDATCPIHAARTGHGRLAINKKGGFEGRLSDTYLDAQVAKQAATEVPAPPVPEADTALAVDEALANVEQKKAEWEAAKQKLEQAIEAEKQAAIARSRAAEKEISRLNAEHEAVIAELREHLVDLEPTPTEE